MPIQRTLTLAFSLGLFALESACGGDALQTETDDAALSTGCGKAHAGGLFTQTIYVPSTGQTRSYEILIPASYNPQTGYELYFGWHGCNGSPDSIRTKNLAMGLTHPQISVFPQGLSIPPPYSCSTGWEMTSPSNVDVAFFDTLYAQLASNYCIDQSRVFTYGFSSGAIFSYSLICSRSSELRAAGIVAGEDVAFAPCSSGESPVSVWATGDADDPTIPIAKQISSKNIWEANDGCSSATVPGDQRYLPCVNSVGCLAGEHVTWCERASGGHTWPSGASYTLSTWFNQF